MKALVENSSGKQLCQEPIQTATPIFSTENIRWTAGQASCKGRYQFGRSLSETALAELQLQASCRLFSHKQNATNFPAIKRHMCKTCSFNKIMAWNYRSGCQSLFDLCLRQQEWRQLHDTNWFRDTERQQEQPSKTS